MNATKFITIEDAIQARPEYLNEKIDDHDKSVYAQGWNKCNDEMYVNLTGLESRIVHCKDCEHYKRGRRFPDMRFCALHTDDEGKPIYYNTMPDDFCSKGKKAAQESRLTQDGYDYCDGCDSTGHCGYFTGQTDVKCGDAAMYDRLREYEQIGCSPRAIENMLFAVKGEQNA